MGSISDTLLRLGPATFVVKAIIAAVVGDVLLIGFILLRRAYRRRYFRKHDNCVLESRKNWDRIVSGSIPYESWRRKRFECGIVEEIALNDFDTATPKDAARLLQFLRKSGLIEKRIVEARRMKGWRRRRALVALGRTRAPEGIHALSEALRDSDKENRQAALRGLGRMASPEAAEEILTWVAESGMGVAALPLQNALINCCRERPQVLVPYLQHASGEIREMLARVMGEVATPALDFSLLNLAEDALPELRAAAARAMPQAQAYRALEVLEELVKDPVWYVRLRAVVALGGLNNPAAIPCILGALTDASRLVRVRAGEALVAQGGELLPNFERVIETRDRYGLHAYLAALDNAGARQILEEELAKNQQLATGRIQELQDILRSGSLPETEPEPAAVLTGADA